MRFLILTTAALAIAACGKVGPLEPAAGQSLPVKPLMATVTPDADALLQLTPQSKPERIDELMTKSQPRRADRFDLPPADGLAPAPEAGAETEPAPSTTGPDNEGEPRR